MSVELVSQRWSHKLSPKQSSKKKNVLPPTTSLRRRVALFSRCDTFYISRVSKKNEVFVISLLLLFSTYMLTFYSSIARVGLFSQFVVFFFHHPQIDPKYTRDVRVAHIYSFDGREAARREKKKSSELSWVEVMLKAENRRRHPTATTSVDVIWRLFFLYMKNILYIFLCTSLLPDSVDSSF